MINQPEKIITIIQETITPIQERAIALQIRDENSLNEASTLLIASKKHLKALKEDMATILDPIKESIATIKAKYEPTQTVLESLIDTLTQKTVTYQTNLVKAQREAELAISERIKPGKGNLSLEKGLEKLESIPQAQKQVTTETGSMSFIEYPMCEVENLSLVPIEFHEANIVLIRQAMKKGLQLPGVRYWTEQRPRNSRS